MRILAALLILLPIVSDSSQLQRGTLEAPTVCGPAAELRAHVEESGGVLYMRGRLPNGTAYFYVNETDRALVVVQPIGGTYCISYAIQVEVISYENRGLLLRHLSD